MTINQLAKLCSQSRRRSRRRDGITLLFVIGLITLFVLLSTTFLVMSVNFLRGSKTYNTGKIQREEPRDQSKTVFYRLVRGTQDPQSAFAFGQGILDDMYDIDNGFVGEVRRAGFAHLSPDLFNLRDAPNPPNSGLLTVTLAPGTAFNLKGVPYTISTVRGAYSGQVMTFVDGPLKDISCRIVDYLVHRRTSDGLLIGVFVIKPENTDQQVNVLRNGTDVQGSRVLVNSKPFAGRGVGYDVSARSDEPAFLPDALVPNRATYYRFNTPAPAARVAARNSVDYYYGVGHANESYDAVDYQNMFLAAMITNGTDLRIIPSYHRPELVRFWMTNSHGAINPPSADPSATNPGNYAPFMPADQEDWDPSNDYYPLTYREFRRQIIFRPMPWDHPTFTGGNPNLAALDSNNDGTPWLPGADNQPGIASYDDDGNGVVDDDSEYGYPGSDDILENDDDLLAILSGNRGFDLWDVDNDGDFINDSIWIDPGLPVQVDSAGRHYKTLAAILVTDMDGRLNLNAHGSRWHQENAYQTFRDVFPTTDPTVATNDIPFRGQGYGPAEISLRTVFADNADYRRLLFGYSFGTATANRVADYQMGLPGRYGTEVENWTATPNAESAPGRATADLLSLNDFMHMPPDENSLQPYDAPAPVLWQMMGRSYSSHADLNGRFGIGLNGYGQPIYDATVNAMEIGNSNYEMDLSNTASRGVENGPGAADVPFSPGELEQVLRQYDGSGGTMPSRLMRLSSTLANNAANERLLVTTDSYDVPVPHNSTMLAGDLLHQVRDRLTNYSTDPITVNDMMRIIVAHELIAGRKMDLNRPFGNGLDDNGNGVVDEHSTYLDWSVNEAASTRGQMEYVWEPDTANIGQYVRTSIFFDHDNNGLPPSDSDDRGFLARQQYARQLYTLMMLLIDDDTEMEFDGDGVPSEDETPYALAQLAINIVDFRDADSIMTPFEFDIDPFNADGWAVDSDPRTTTEPTGTADRALVWGVERPELMLTEAFATHDRRTEDLSDYGELSDNNEDDFDQRLRPEGSLFVELYNPWSLTSRPPAELYGTDSDSGVFGVELDRVDYATGDSPVWRIAVAKPDNPDTLFLNKYMDENGGDRFLDPDQWNPNNNLRMDPDNVERTIYFVDTDPGYNDSERVYVPTTTVRNNLIPVAPHQTAVLGPTGRPISPTNNLTLFGRRSDIVTPVVAQADLLYDQTRSISLNSQGHTITTMQPSLSDPAMMDTVTKDTVAIPIPQLSISEPVTGYPAANFDDALEAGEGAYNPPIDEPLDEARITDASNPEPAFAQDGTHRGYRILHLQRLANPLIPYDAVQNPYMTIDSAHVDLTIYHGVTNVTDAEYGMMVNINEPKEYEFASEERGESEVANARPANQSRQLWPIELNPNEFQDPTDSSYQNVGDMHYHDYHLFESLGGSIWNTYNRVNSAWSQPRDLQDPISNATIMGQATKWDNPADDAVAFPWLTFNNRPFVSGAEIMMVPAGRASRMLYDFTLNTSGGALDDYEPDQFVARFGHLQNFYRTTDDPRSFPTAQLYKLFDFVHVPSRYTKTDQLVPTQLYNQLIVYDSTGPAYDVFAFNAPFNQFSEFREPGKINLNTIFDQRVFEGLMGHVPNTTYGNHRWPGPTWAQFVASRRGYGGTDILGASSNVPSYFSNPFRDGDGGNLVVQQTGMPVRPDVEGTLLRSRGGNGSGAALFDASTSGDFNNSERNAYFKEHARFRLDNLVTTRSNVFAIWITLGYFEYDPATDQLGQELGSYRGGITRHRSFYIIDRSIPVGYQPGENRNVQNLIRVERYLE